MKKYTESHEWVAIENEIATIGVTDHAQKELGDIVYVELPELGRDVKAGEEVAVLESTKAAADVYTPISGKIIAVNQNLSQESEWVNRSPEAEGWIFKIQFSDRGELSKLMDEAEYKASIK